MCRNAQPSIRWGMCLKKEAASEGNEVGCVRWTQGWRVEAGTGAGAICCHQNGLVEASRANEVEGALTDDPDGLHQLSRDRWESLHTFDVNWGIAWVTD